MFKEIHFKEIESTHEWAEKERASLGEGFYFITSDFQTKGVGRRGTHWLSPTGVNLLGTFVIPSPPLPFRANLSQLLAFTTIQVLEMFPLLPLFKWPNDLLLSHKKVGGILTTADETTAFVSIGLNVNMRAKDLDGIDIPATSIYEELHHEVPLASLKLELMSQFETNLRLFTEKGFAPFFPRFANKLAFKGKFATVDAYSGKIVGLAPDGRLILSSPEGHQLVSTGHLIIRDEG